MAWGTPPPSSLSLRSLALVPRLLCGAGAGQPWESPPSTQPCHSAELQELGRRWPALPGQPQMTLGWQEDRRCLLVCDSPRAGRRSGLRFPPGALVTAAESSPRCTLAGGVLLLIFQNRGKRSHCYENRHEGTPAPRGECRVGNIPPSFEPSPWSSLWPATSQKGQPPASPSQLSQPLLEGDGHLYRERTGWHLGK